MADDLPTFSIFSFLSLILGSPALLPALSQLWVSPRPLQHLHLLKGVTSLGRGGSFNGASITTPLRGQRPFFIQHKILFKRLIPPLASTPLLQFIMRVKGGWPCEQSPFKVSVGLSPTKKRKRKKRKKRRKFNQSPILVQLGR